MWNLFLSSLVGSFCWFLPSFLLELQTSDWTLCGSLLIYSNYHQRWINLKREYKKAGWQTALSRLTTCDVCSAPAVHLMRASGVRRVRTGVCWLNWRLALCPFGCEHRVVVAFSVSGDLHSKELDSGGWNHQKPDIHFLPWETPFGPVRHSQLTKYGVVLAVVLLTVQTQQGAVVEVLHDSLKLIAEGAPGLGRRSYSSVGSTRKINHANLINSYYSL